MLLPKWQINLIVNQINYEVNQGREFHNKLMQEWLDNSDIYSTPHTMKASQ